MRISHLKFLIDYKQVSLSAIGSMSSVSRQRVSQWLKSNKPIVNIGTIPLMNLSAALDVNPGFFLDANPELDDDNYIRSLEAALLWDYLYPNIACFLRAIVHHENHALARLVEVYGLFQSATIMGNIVWKNFDKYKERIPPGRREELETLWKRQRELALI